VTMNSIMMGEDVVNAMDLRCFGQRPRTWLYELKYQRRDYLLIAFSVAVLVASFITTTVFDIGGFTVPPAFLALFS